MITKANESGEQLSPEAAHTGCAWRPDIDVEPQFNPFASTGFSGDGRTQVAESDAEPPAIRDATEDTAPLEGSRDLSDADSLRDVVAAACIKTIKR